MLMEEFTKWLETGKHTKLPSSVDFDEFTYFFTKREEGKDVAQQINDLAYEIYQLQVCVEGLLDDHLYIGDED